MMAFPRQRRSPGELAQLHQAHNDTPAQQSAALFWREVHRRTDKRRTINRVRRRAQRAGLRAKILPGSRSWSATMSWYTRR